MIETRTVCHGCRSTTYDFDTSEEGTNVLRPVVVPGNGGIAGMVAAEIEAGETPVTRACPSCADSATPGWLPTLVPPL